MGALSAYLQNTKTPKSINNNQQIRHSSLRNHIKGKFSFIINVLIMFNLIDIYMSNSNTGSILQNPMI